MRKDDPTILSICLSIKTELKNEQGIDIDIDSIYDAANSQFAILPKVMEEKANIRFDKFGKFEIKEGVAKNVIKKQKKEIT